MLIKENRITKQRDFDLFFGKKFKELKGRNIASTALIVKIVPAQTEMSRVGFIVNNKIDKRATTRNKIKRQLREIVQAKLKFFTKKIDLLIITKAGVRNKEYEELEADVLSLLKKGRAL